MAEEALDVPENGKDTRSRDVPETKKDIGPSLVETAIPIPDFFYDIRSSLPLVGSSPSVVRSLTNVLYLITIGVFVASFAYYSLPAQLLSEESIVTSEWRKEGFTCKPLHTVTIGGLSTDWTFDECISATSSPNTDNVIAVVKSDASTQFDYRFATQGDSSLVTSIHDERVASSILQETSDAWSRDGFSCFPEVPYDNVYNVRHNYSECMSNVLNPSLETVHIKDNTNQGGIDANNGGYYASGVTYFPFGSQGSCYQRTRNSTNDVYNRLETLYNALTTYDIFDGDNECYSSIPWIIQGITLSSVDDCVTTVKYMPCTQPEVTMERHITAWSTVLNTPSDASGTFGKELICESMKRNGKGFRCFDKPKPPTTKE